MPVKRVSDPSGIRLMSPQCFEGFDLRDKGGKDTALETLCSGERGKNGSLAVVFGLLCT